MKNTLTDLNNILFEQLERLNDDEIMQNSDKAKSELERAKGMSQIASQIANTAKTQLDAFRFAEEYRIKQAEMPDLLKNRNVQALEEKDAKTK